MIPSLWRRPAPPARLAVRHDRRESGWCTLDDRLLAAAVRLDEALYRRHCPWRVTP